MTLDDHTKYLGALIVNFQSLEFILRAFLSKLPNARPFGLPHGTDIYLSAVGSDLPLNDMTSYDSLGQLIEKFNAEMRSRGGTGLDPTLVHLRDALAHGRVSGAVPGDVLRLIKFDKPHAGRVRVAFNEAMSETWFRSQRSRLLAAVKHVYQQIS